MCSSRLCISTCHLSAYLFISLVSLSLYLSLSREREKLRARTLDHAHRLEVALLHTPAALEIEDVGHSASVFAADCAGC
jgi:hypothetical protein